MPKFVTRKWTEVNDLSGRQYSVNKNLMFKIPMLRSDLCDCSDAYIFVKGTINVEGTSNAYEKNKKLVFKSNVV